MSPLPDISELIFPSAHTSINQTLSSLKRMHLSITNRLNSIVHDAEFVSEVASAYQLPVIANERCGSWYVHPDLKAGSAYFKSTDGHHGQWSFSLRRLNLQVLEAVGEHGGCIIVDSTRKGKSMPDALSKTAPIWIAVLNRLLFPEDIDAGELRTPDDVVSRSEHACIEARIPGFVSDVNSLQLDKQSLRATLGCKPLEPVWVTPDTALPISVQRPSRRNLVVLCTASGRTSSERAVSNYVQGAADDSESWALGLRAETFWKHSKQLLSTPEDELPALILSNENQSSRPGSRQPVLIRPTTNIWISDNSVIVWGDSDFDVVISCSERPIEALTSKLKASYIHLECTTGKVGSRQLRAQLHKLQALSTVLSDDSRVLVTCQTGRDLAVGIALAIICLRCSESGAMQTDRADWRPELSKAIIKHRLSWIMVCIPDVSPSRATLQSVNAFLLG